MITKNYYNPNIAIHAGETLKEVLEKIGMSQIDLAERTGLTPKTINEIIKGKSSITPDTAIKLSAVFGMSANFWNNLQRSYEETLVRLQEEERVKGELPYLPKFYCYNELVQWGYIEKTRDPKKKVINLLNFFGVSSLSLMPKINEVAFSEIAYRRSEYGDLSNESLAAWLRCGELDAQKITTQQYNKEKLVESIRDLRILTKENPEVFQKKLVEICSSFGIAVVFVPYFKNTYVNGATRWINSEKAIIQLNTRGARSDIFWFTFFHELSHLLKHGKKKQFIEFKEKSEIKNAASKKENITKKEEREANEFACDTMIPKIEYEKFIRKQLFSDQVIASFANKLNICPDIVAGRLSREFKDWKRFSHLRGLLKFNDPN